MDKVAIITGAGSGFGRSSALLFADEGAKVALVDIDESSGLETLRMITEKDGDALFLKSDVTRAQEAETMVKRTVDKYGKVNVLMNNVGVWLMGSVTELTEEVWDKVMDINLKSVFLCSKYVIPELIKAGGGSIINLSSIMGKVGFPSDSVYCASKAGVILLTKVMALDYGQYNIRVNAICPGDCDTPMVQRYLKSQKNPEVTLKAMEEVYPFKRLGRPIEVAYAALYLASDESSFTTGSELMVDGGYTAK
ncbi:MAG: glucose 1-dehydrogenase [Candidatus Bathyarchaeia archaeon]